MKQFLLFLTIFGLFQLGIGQNLPTPRAFLGYEPGAHFAPHAKVVGYMEALARAVPTQMKLAQYGTTNERRPLVLAVIASVENMARIESIRQYNLGLAGMAKGQEIINPPVIVWLSYNVHGNEAASSNAVMMTAHYLLSAENAKQWLKNTVVIIDPCINPDGYSRYSDWYNGIVGDQPNPDPTAREHQEPWPGGRSNHYNFDLNRDWAWQTQVESQARMVKYNQWMPQIHVDFHEQGYNEPYYFAPAAEPYHEVITNWQRQFQVQIGRNHAKYFDANGWLYFTKERFDLLYPSYGDTWPTYNGSIGMTYEQGGIRAGLAIVNVEGDTLTLRDRVLHHHTTGISTVEIASQNAINLQNQFKKYFDNVNTNGSGEFKTFVVKAKGNEGKLAELKLLLERNGIAYSYAIASNIPATSNFFSGRNEPLSLETGDLLISTVQPKGVLARVLFEPKSKLSDSATYDITAWSIPYGYGVNTYGVKEKLLGSLELSNPVANKVSTTAYGYVVRWNGMASARFLAACLKKGVKVRLPQLAFETEGNKFPAGSLVLLKTSNKNIIALDETLQLLANDNKVQLEPLTTGFMDKGPDFGSPDVGLIKPLRIAMLSGEGTSSLSTGEVWHYFERDLQYPITIINVANAGSADWRKFDVVILADGFNYNALLSKEGALKKWVDQGGKLIALENAVATLSKNDWGIVERKSSEDKPAASELLLPYSDRERNSLRYNNPGSIYKVQLDQSHPLAFGLGNTYFTLKGDAIIYDYVTNGWNVGVIKKDPLVAGFSGIKVIESLKDGVLFGELNVGRGKVIFLTDNVLFRNFWQNGKLMMANAVFFPGQ